MTKNNTNGNLIRNRSFMTKEPEFQDNIEFCLRDIRRDFSQITVNGRPLRDVFKKYLDISDTLSINTLLKLAEESGCKEKNLTSLLFKPYDKGLLKEKLIDLIIHNQLKKEHIHKLFTEELLSFSHPEKMTEKLLQNIIRVMHQHGLMYAAKRSLSDAIESKDENYFMGSTVTKLNIFMNNAGIYIEESIDLMSIDKPPTGKKNNSVTNIDNSSLLRLQSRIHLKPNINTGIIDYKNTDLTLQYNNSLAKRLCDKRSVFEKFKDVIKSFFSKNTIKPLAASIFYKEQLVKINNSKSSIDDENIEKPQAASPNNS